MSQELAAKFFRCFSTPDGQRVLEALEKKYPEVTEPLGEEQLRHSVGQRSVISFIRRQIARGGENNDTGSSTD